MDYDQGTITRFPAEILTMIFSNLSPIDVKAARYVCKIFLKYSSQFLIDTIIVGSQTKTLERSDEISQHDLFRYGITTVVFSACSLQHDYATVDEYCEDLLDHARLTKRKMPTMSQCRLYWQRYQGIYKDQAKTQRDGDDRTRIKGVLGRLPNMKHLVLSGNAWKSSAHPLREEWNAGDSAIITPSCDPVDGPWQLSHGFEVMSFALNANNIQLDSLIHTGIEHRNSSFRSQPEKHGAQKLFRSLRKICLYFDEESLHWHDQVEICLLNATGLEYLDLEVEIVYDQATFSNLFFNTWPMLSYLSLQLDLNYEPFIIFCQRHDKTLRCLHLRNNCLFGGTWKQLVNVLSRVLHLTEATLEGLAEASRPGFAWELGERLPGAEYYLIHGGEDIENPFGNGTLRLESLG